MAHQTVSWTAIFPELLWVENTAIRTAVAATWQKAWEASAWARLEDCPYNAHVPGLSLVSHVRQVTQGALALFEGGQRAGVCGGNRDVLVSAALLHDVSKVVEYEPSPETHGGARVSHLGSTLQHAVYGAHLAMTLGVPDEVVSVIVSHAQDSRTVPTSSEGICVYYADIASADLARLGQGAELHLTRHKARS